MKPSINEYLVQKQATLLQTMAKIDKGAEKIAFLVDENNHLLAAITDGDIRRALLSGVSLHASIEGIGNPNPVFLPDNAPKASIRKLLFSGKLQAVPLVDEAGCLTDIAFLTQILRQPQEKTPVVIMAGGLGSRLGALTQNTPKPMLKVGGLPILHHIINHVKLFGYHNIFLSVNYKAEVISNYFGNGKAFGVDINYIKEPKRLGTGGSLRLATESLLEPFFVINGDLLTDLPLNEMMQFHKEQGFDVTMATRKYSVCVPYGVIKKTPTQQIVGIEEKPELHFLINAGMYCINPSVLSHIPEDTFFDLTSLVEKPLAMGSYETTGYWLDVGKKEDYQQADEDFRQGLER